MAVDPVVVGVDSSPSSHTALRWAAAEAASHHRPLHIVHSYEWPGATDLLWPPGHAISDYVDRANALVDEAAAEAGGAFPALVVTTSARPGDATQMLLNASRHAVLVVVGGRGHGRLTDVLLGSVGQAVVTRSRCSVAVVHGEPAVLTGPVLVGVDSSPGADVALQAAFEDAAARAGWVLAVRAWSPPTPSRSDVRPLVADVAEIETAERRALAELVQPWQERYPNVPVDLRLVPGDAGDVLVAASQEAQLTVVGTRGRGGVTGLLLGSVSQQVLHEASGALLVARARNEDADHK